MDMNHHCSLLFVLIDRALWRESADSRPDHDDVTPRPECSGADFPSTRVSGGTMCMLVHAGDVHRMDSDLEQWVLATATKFAALKERYAQLTPRERQVLPLIAEGMLNKQATAILGISEATLQIHRRRIMEKLRARSFADLVRMADRLGIMTGADTVERASDSRRDARCLAARPGNE